jgi:acyl-CoA thioesterase-1
MYNILIFGDSISAGRGVDKIKCWVSLLAQFLDTKDKNSILVHNLSIPGDSTNEVIKRFSIEVNARCKKIYPDDRSSIIFEIGINDAKCIGSKDNPVTKLGDFRENIRLLIKNAKKYTDHIIFVGLTLVDENKTAPIDNAYFLNDKIKIYNKVIKNECKKRNIIFVDMIKEWSKVNYSNLLSDDGIHPNEKGHKKIFEKMKKIFIDNL